MTLRVGKVPTDYAREMSGEMADLLLIAEDCTPFRKYKLCQQAAQLAKGILAILDREPKPE